MISLLLIISFLLHIILISIVYYLHQQVQYLKQQQHHEFEALFSEFLQEVKAENAKLQQRLQDQSDRKTTADERISPKEQSTLKKEPKDENLPPLLKIEKTDQIETSIEGQILQLHQQGFSIEKIAKKVGRGKTEVGLMIKLRKQHDYKQKS